jgi:hypothetical protein
MIARSRAGCGELSRESSSLTEWAASRNEPSSLVGTRVGTALREGECGRYRNRVARRIREAMGRTGDESGDIEGASIEISLLEVRFRIGGYCSLDRAAVAVRGNRIGMPEV